MDSVKTGVIRRKLLITVVDYIKEKQLTDLYLANHIPLNLVTHGHGTANSDMLDYLGLGETKKNVTFSIVAENKLHGLFSQLEQKMHLNHHGNGVAFTLPLSCISNVLTCLDSDFHQENSLGEECEEKIMKSEKMYELIIVIVTQGYKEETMEAAKAAGAKGGTVVHAKGLGSPEAAKFLEITVQPEKELILILTKRELKSDIMESMNKAVGINTKARGIMFSVPVDEAVGLDVNF
ncbi:MAG: P-II family nitrogen regulator [Anaerocolumna sp.]